MGVGKGNNPNSHKGLKHIQKGQVLNPLGGKAHNPIKKELRKFANKELLEIVHIACTGTPEDLQAIVNNPKSTVVQMGVAKCLYEAARKADWVTLRLIIAEIVGKVPDKILVGNTEDKSFKIEFVDP